MWVKVESIADGSLVGSLESKPFDMPGLRKGEHVEFARYHAIAVIFVEAEKERRISRQGSQKQYWDRCLIDCCVLDDGVPVGFIYREEPEPTREGDKDPDSGWRIRGDARGFGAEEVDKRQIAYVALGAALNRDDSWLSLIDKPIGSAFLRNFDAGTYERQND